MSCFTLLSVFCCSKLQAGLGKVPPPARFGYFAPERNRHPQTISFPAKRGHDSPRTSRKRLTVTMLLTCGVSKVDEPLLFSLPLQTLRVLRALYSILLWSLPFKPKKLLDMSNFSTSGLLLRSKTENHHFRKPLFL